MRSESSMSGPQIEIPKEFWEALFTALHRPTRQATMPVRVAPVPPFPLPFLAARTQRHTWSGV
jgi:hypothetical protein